MKEETKELIKWIKEACSSFVYAAEDFKTNLSRDKLCDEAEKFLDSLPEIESHLCRGGYIQDRNGTPCCDGDKVMYKSKEYTLQWGRPYSRFFLKADNSLRDVWKFCSVEILKVEK